MGSHPHWGAQVRDVVFGHSLRDEVEAFQKDAVVSSVRLDAEQVATVRGQRIVLCNEFRVGLHCRHIVDVDLVHLRGAGARGVGHPQVSVQVEFTRVDATPQVVRVAPATLYALEGIVFGAWLRDSTEVADFTRLRVDLQQVTCWVARLVLEVDTIARLADRVQVIVVLVVCQGVGDPTR